MKIALGIPTIADPEDTAVTDWRLIDDAAAARDVEGLSAEGRDQDVHTGLVDDQTHLQPAKLSRRVFNGAPEATSLLRGCFPCLGT
ncbi:hypothetical protein QA641_38165 [Bradyrhizobium sp. CB1650]|uniref:hypothetical protein n=1 Tax=Bradyrhizobium sp. CB1650 TaxID=3039153 RepID=UPI002434BB6E|nr:hypothetical protein [Bradyrhizobium sp. CB1650]WGD51252.1 hypothetical protein QA641_38165 [Bradyrhizobium sp. CB1650]